MAGIQLGWVASNRPPAGLHDTADRNHTPGDNRIETLLSGTAEGHTQDRFDHPPQPPPPLTLPGPGQIRSPATTLLALGDTLSDGRNCRLEPLPVVGRAQPVNTPAERTVESAEKHRHHEAGKIGRNKAMPPKGGVTTGTTRGLLPRIIAPQSSQGIDVYRNTEYQEINSLPGVWSLLGGGG